MLSPKLFFVKSNSSVAVSSLRKGGQIWRLSASTSRFIFLPQILLEAPISILNLLWIFNDWESILHGTQWPAETLGLDFVYFCWTNVKAKAFLVIGENGIISSRTLCHTDSYTNESGCQNCKVALFVYAISIVDFSITIEENTLYKLF